MREIKKEISHFFADFFLGGLHQADDVQPVVDTDEIFIISVPRLVKHDGSDA